METGGILNTQMICGRIYAIMDGFLCELERVGDEHIESDSTDADSSVTIN